MSNYSRRSTIGRYLCLVWIGITALSANAQTWVEDSFEDFSDGRLDAAGQNIYVSHDGTIRTIQRFDLNQDGYLDLVFNSTHDTVTDVEATLATFTATRRVTQSPLAVPGSLKAALGDLNRDGYLDIVFCPNDNGIQGSRQFVSIAWGGADGWPSHRINGVLPVWSARTVAIADLNHDDWPDIIVLTPAPKWKDGKVVKKVVIRVFWGGPKGFSLLWRQDVDLPAAADMAAADFDADGAEDLAVLTGGNKIVVFWATAQKSEDHVDFTRTEIPLPGGLRTRCLTAGDINGDGQIDLVIGTRQDMLYTITGKAGRGWNKPTKLPAVAASHVAVGDLDDDGHADLVLTTMAIKRAAGGERGAATGEGGVRVLWGNGRIFNYSRSSSFEVKHASASAIGDLDGDGKSDLALAVYQGQTTFVADSVVFFGATGRSFKRGTGGIRTSGATHVVIAPPRGKLPARAVFTNSSGGTLDEKVPIYVYWGGRDGFDPERRWELPFTAGYEASAADLNADGFVDLIALNSGHGSGLDNPTLGANIFWGSPEGFDIDNHRTVLRENSLFSSNVADLDRDGYLDLILGGFGEVLIVYYGSADGYDRGRRDVVTSMKRSAGTAVADFNRDDWLDIAVTCSVTSQVRIFWGSSKGFAPERVSTYYTPRPIGLEVADLNADGRLDLIVGSYSDPIAGLHDTGIQILWGSDEGFKNWNSQWLPGMTPLGMAVADFDADGFLDLFSPHYHGNGVREAMPCYLYWGGADGLSTSRKTILICNSAHDAMAGDFNQDGLIDLAVSCHSSHGSHQTTSKVFYNDGKRFANPETVLLPTPGSHWMYLQDVGHIYDRRWRQTYESSVFGWDGPSSGGSLSFKADIPGESEMSFLIRSAEDEKQLNKHHWRKVTDGRFVLEATDRVVQYQAVFTSDNGDRYPILDRVVIELKPY